MRFILVDKITEIENGKYAKGIKNVSMSEDYFAHHFIFFPVMPGMLMIESLVQLSSWLISYSTDFSAFGLLGSVSNSKFKHTAQPGDVLALEVKWMEKIENRVKFKGKVISDENVCVTVQFETEIIPVHIYQNGKESLKKMYDQLTSNFAKVYFGQKQ